jgi:hypothetical protein
VKQYMYIVGLLQTWGQSVYQRFSVDFSSSFNSHSILEHPKSQTVLHVLRLVTVVVELVPEIVGFLVGGVIVIIGGGSLE